MGFTTIEARDMILCHRNRYPVYWEWSDAAETRLMLHGEILSPSGWIRFATGDTTSRSARNHPIQTAGADILRAAVIVATEAGFRIIGTAHDSILIESPEDRIQDDVAAVQQIMVDASAWVLGGFALRVDVPQIIHYPDRMWDERGAEFGEKVWKLVEAEVAKSENNVEIQHDSK
jgi:hypothetical protein